MFILFGWSKKPSLVKTLLTTYCYECNKDTSWDWLKLTEWVSLFFINVIPFKSQHFLACQNCGDHIQFTKDEVDSVKVLQKLSKADSDLLHDNIVRRIEVSQLGDKTETQVKWIKLEKEKNTDK